MGIWKRGRNAPVVKKDMFNFIQKIAHATYQLHALHALAVI